MGKKKSIGLPGGPNEFLQDITQYISVEGYKRTSSDINNPVNIIESGSITMKDVDFPVYGVDNLGNEQMMLPENEYQFPGDMVVEIPQAQLGKLGKLAKPYVKKGIQLIKNYFDDGVRVTDDVVEETPNAMSFFSDTPKRLNRPAAEDYVFYRNTSNPESIMKPLDFANPRVYSSWKAPENLSFFTPSNSAFRDYGAQKWGAKIRPNNPFIENKARTYSIEDVQKMIDDGHDAIITNNYGKSDIRDAYQIIPLDKSIISELKRYKELGGSLPKAQKGLGWLRPYAKKGVKYLQDLFESTNDFKSQIDWGKWNKAIPENQKLLQEYNLIEETTKANKTWMKNADGSAFAGTPEQFVQMKSGNFQKAFGDSKVQDILMHRTDEVFDVFDPKKIGSRTDNGFYGEGFYFHPEDIAKRYDNFYGNISMPSYVNIVNPYTGKQTIEVGKQLAKDIDGRIIMGRSGSDVVRPVEYMSTNPNNIKSAIGNDGMFDLTNPNIYKQLGGKATEIRQYEEPSFFEKAADVLASPMTSFGYSVRGQDIPDGVNVNNPNRNAFDSVIDMINPFAWAQYAENADRNLEKGEYIDAGFDALGAIPIVPAWLSKGKNIKEPVKQLVKPIVNKAKEIIEPLVKKTDDMVEVFTTDGSKKLMKKSEAIRLNRIEDANINNKTFVNYEDGNWFSNEITPFYLNNAKNSLKPGMLNPKDPKRLFSVYLDPADAKQFNVTTGVATERAANMSGGMGNMPVSTEYVLPPSLVKRMRANEVGSGYNTMIGNSESIMQNLTEFYKRLGGSFQDGGSWRDIEINLDGVKKSVAQAESLGGKLMKNKQSTASGLYGQRFSELDKLGLYDGTRDEFIKDLKAQDDIFLKRLYEGFVDENGETIVTPLVKDAYDLTIEYKDQLGDDWDYSYEDIINLSNFLGRQGARKYFGEVIRDGKGLEEVYPHLFGDQRTKGKDGKPLENKTPVQYLETSRKFYQDGGEEPKTSFLYDLEKIINASLGDVNNRAKAFSDNPEGLENIDNMRHATGGRYAAEAIQQKVRDIPYAGGLLDFIGADKAAGFIGANVLGIGHELRTMLGGDERPFLTQLQEMGEDSFNNYVGSIVGSLDIDDSKKDEVIRYLSYNNLLPDGYVKTKQGVEEEGLSENVYFKDKDGNLKRPAYSSGGSLLKGQYGNREVNEVQQDNTRVALPRVPRLPLQTLPILEDDPRDATAIFQNPFGNYEDYDPSNFVVQQDNTYVDSTSRGIPKYVLDAISENPNLTEEQIENILLASQEDQALMQELSVEYQDPVLIADFIKKSNYYAEGWKDMTEADEYEIQDLQNILVAKGYDIGRTGADGIYGNRTYAAHRAMVDDSNLDPTAISRYYKKYSKDTYDEVKSIQERLIKEGYMSPTLLNGRGSSIDGKFGDQTRAAIDAYNTDNFDEDINTTVFNNIPNRLDEPRCAAGMCTILERNDILTEAIGVKYKDAWDLYESMESAENSERIFNIYDDVAFKNIDENTPIEELKLITNKVKKNKKNQTKASDYQVGDIVGIYWQGSSHHAETLGSKTFNTHSGFVSDINEDGIPIITHNVNGKVIQQPYNELTTAWIRRPNEDVEIKSTYVVTDEDVSIDPMAIPNLERKWGTQLSPKRKEIVNNILKRATYNSTKIPEILNSSVDPEWLKTATFGITGVESGVGANAPRTVDEARGENFGLQGIAYDLKGREDSSISLGIGKTKYDALDNFAREYFNITGPEDLSDDNKSVDAISYILTKNYELFKDYAQQYPSLGLTEQDIRNMSILAYNQGSNRLINTGRVDDDRSPEEEVAALRDLYEGTMADISSTKYKYLGPVGDAAYSLALNTGLEKPGEKYISKVNNYIEDVFPMSYAYLNESDPFQVTTMARGGEYGVFKNYIMGDYDGTNREVFAKNLHDRLNRKHYKQAKSAGMSPANYIMTKIIDNS